MKNIPSQLQKQIDELTKQEFEKMPIINVLIDYYSSGKTWDDVLLYIKQQTEKIVNIITTMLIFNGIIEHKLELLIYKNTAINTIVKELTIPCKKIFDALGGVQ